MEPKSIAGAGCAESFWNGGESKEEEVKEESGAKDGVDGAE